MVSNFLANKFKIDSMTAFAVSSLLIGYVNKETIDFRLGTMAIVVAIFVWIGYAYIYPYLCKKKSQMSNHTSLNVYGFQWLATIVDYMKHNPKFFQVTAYQCGSDGPYPSVNNLTIPAIDCVTEINDTKFNVRGTLIPRVWKKQINKDNIQEDVYIELKTNDSSALEYFNLISKELEVKRAGNNRLTCTYLRVDKSTNGNYQNNESLIYDGVKDSDQERYDKYMKSFFSSAKTNIWNFVSHVHFHPEFFYSKGQMPCVNYLFYGPPGTGKSNLAYRLAIATGRHLVNLNLLDFIYSKAHVFQLLMNPYVSGRGRRARECIILMEEFDNTLRELVEREKRSRSVKKFFRAPAYFPGSESESSDSESSESESGSEKKKKSEKEPMIKAGDSSTLCLGDLLEILQGAVPIDGLIVIATTNNYKYIRETLPALVRPGRLTPVLIDYLDWETLQELAVYYFGERLEMEEIKIKYPTSGLVELAISCTFEKNPKEQFEKRLRELARISDTSSD